MFRDKAPKGGASAVQQARRLRREMSLPEVLLWQELRKRPDGLKFRRQRPTGRKLSLDFFCSDARLAIEVDGEAHGRGDRPERDANRDAWLDGVGVATLRIPAVEVLGNLSGVVEHILATARARLPLHHPAAPGGPPPRDELGEE
ncbi:MAG: endonuclease domain-containing protein [Sphingomonas sp.]|uniref:endonuclease domain-containing protein n=1 Tax=Sphingomonas sp. TaxID=28214 RepID=UPI003F820452